MYERRMDRDCAKAGRTKRLRGQSSFGIKGVFLAEPLAFQGLTLPTKRNWPIMKQRERLISSQEIMIQMKSWDNAELLRMKRI